MRVVIIVAAFGGDVACAAVVCQPVTRWKGIRARPEQRQEEYEGERRADPRPPRCTPITEQVDRMIRCHHKQGSLKTITQAQRRASMGMRQVLHILRSDTRTGRNELHELGQRRGYAAPCACRNAGLGWAGVPDTAKETPHRPAVGQWGHELRSQAWAFNSLRRRCRRRAEPHTHMFHPKTRCLQSRPRRNRMDRRCRLDLHTPDHHNRAQG